MPRNENGEDGVDKRYAQNVQTIVGVLLFRVRQKPNRTVALSPCTLHVRGRLEFSDYKHVHLV